MAFRWGIIIALAMALAACGSHSVRSQYYTLRAGAAAPTEFVATPAGADAGDVIGIGPVYLPGQLKRKQILSFTDGQEVVLASHAFWADELDALITRALAQGVAGQLGNPRVMPFPWSRRSRPETRVEVRVLELGGRLGGEVQLSALWQIVGASLDAPASGSFKLVQPAVGQGYEGYTRAVNMLLDELAVAIADSLRGVSQI